MKFVEGIAKGKPEATDALISYCASIELQMEALIELYKIRDKVEERKKEFQERLEK